ncbi:RICIN domain-containing protein [Kitasatospora sp. NPDC002543]
MSISRRIGAVAVAAVLSGAAVGTASAAGDDAPAASLPVVAFQAKAQDEMYDTNLAHPDDTAVTTQTPELGAKSQDWRFKRVGESHEGTGIYTIEAADDTGRCIKSDGVRRPVLLEECNDGNIAQRWYVDTGLEHTTIVSEKNKNAALAAEGAGQVVKPVETFGKPGINQLWTFIYF